MRNRMSYVIALVAMLNLGTAVTATQSAPSATDAFTWSAELVSVDEAARAITVKARVAYQDAISELKQFKAGEPVWVIWSGVSDYSDAVRQVKRPDANRQIAENLVMPAELVSPEATNQFVTLRVKVPEAGIAAIKTVKPGEWVTVTARHRPATGADAVVAVRPYGDSAKAAPTSTN